MKCSKCGSTAVINLHQHHLRLCEAHLLDFYVSMVQRAIEHYSMFWPEDRLLVAVSGGKDSLALWDVLLRLEYHAEGLYIDLGIDEGIGYSATSRMMCERFVAEHHPQARLHVVDLRAEHGSGIPELARAELRGRNKPCAVCGLVKRHIMNRAARDGGFAAIATGHNLDDEVAVLFQNTLHWKAGYLARQAPVLDEQEGLARKVKPLVRCYERESAAYVLLRGIDYVYDECPFSKGATTNFYKELLNDLEMRSPAAKQQFYLHFLQARESGVIRFSAQAGGGGEGESGPPLQICTRCGQPTVALDLCAFCRLWERH
ncbi:MAG TPA: ATP-binding protein [Anaerolineae bacterium]|nr:ATP-binding protein [Anaerolineae bacterium]